MTLRAQVAVAAATRVAQLRAVGLVVVVATAAVVVGRHLLPLLLLLGEVVSLNRWLVRAQGDCF